MSTLKLIPDPTFKADVEISVPGQEKPGTIGLTFKYMARKQYLEWVASLEEKKDAKGKVVRKGKTTAEAFPEFVEGWSLPDEFNQNNIEIFLDSYPTSYLEIFSKYAELLISSKIKNFKLSPLNS